MPFDITGFAIGQTVMFGKLPYKITELTSSSVTLLNEITQRSETYEARVLKEHTKHCDETISFTCRNAVYLLEKLMADGNDAVVEAIIKHLGYNMIEEV